MVGENVAAYRGLNVWAPDASAFPGDAPFRDQATFALRWAVLAPSGHNTQPWRFRVGDDRVDVVADRTRALPVVDPDDRELVISCAAAGYTLELALRRFGVATHRNAFPDIDDADVVIRVALDDAGGIRDDEGELFDAITQRHTNRTSYEDRPVSEPVTADLVAAAAAEGARLIPAGADGRDDLAELIAEGDRLQMGDAAFRRELATWLHANRTRRLDGIRGYGFGFGDLMSVAGPLVVRTFDTGKGQAAKDRALAAGSPLLAVLGTDDDSPEAWVMAGRALQRVLLTATAAGLACGFLNQPVEVAALRPRVAQRFGVVTPQLVLRFGFAPPATPEPRRPVEEVLVG